MSIIFLDIDGVLNCKHLRTAARRDGGIYSARGTDITALIDPVRVARLSRLAHATQATVVLSSQWRELFGMVRTQAALDANEAEFTISYQTPVLPSGDRAQEIRDFMTDICAAFRFEGKYVILDDMRAAGEGHGEAFVHVPDGLEDAHVTQAMRVLGVAT